MKSPGYRAAPHEWGWAWGVVSRIDPALLGSPDIDVRAGGRDEASVVGRNRPAMKSPGYRAAPHEWGWAWDVVSRIDPALLGSPDIDVRAVGRDEASVVGRNRPAMKSPGYRAAPHEWGWAWGVVSRIDPALPGSPDIDVRAVGRDEASVVGRNRPAMKSPGYRAAPHEWGWAWGVVSRIDPALLGSPDIDVRAGGRDAAVRLAMGTARR